MSRRRRLEALQQQAGSLGVERVVRDTDRDLGKRDLDGLAVNQDRQGEWLGAGRAAEDSGGRTRRVVVIAEPLAAQGE